MTGAKPRRSGSHRHGTVTVTAPLTPKVRALVEALKPTEPMRTVDFLVALKRLAYFLQGQGAVAEPPAHEAGVDVGV